MSATPLVQTFDTTTVGTEQHQFRSAPSMAWLPSKFLRIADVKPTEQHLYVINMTGQPDSSGQNHGVRGMVALTVTLGPNEDPQTIIIPNTWAPVDVAAIVGTEAVLRNPSFRTLVTKNILRIVPTSEVELLRNTNPNYSSEIERVTHTDAFRTQPIPIIGSTQSVDPSLALISQLLSMASAGSISGATAVASLTPLSATFTPQMITSLIESPVTEISNFGNSLIKEA